MRLTWLQQNIAVILALALAASVYVILQLIEAGEVGVDRAYQLLGTQAVITGASFALGWSPFIGRHARTIGAACGIWGFLLILSASG